jgi:hypothetical protein
VTGRAVSTGRAGGRTFRSVLNELNINFFATFIFCFNQAALADIIDAVLLVIIWCYAKVVSLGYNWRFMVDEGDGLNSGGIVSSFVGGGIGTGEDVWA